MKKLILFILLMPCLASAQTYWTPGIPPGTTSTTLSTRYLGTDSLANFYFGISNRWSQLYTATQVNGKFQPIEGVVPGGLFLSVSGTTASVTPGSWVINGKTYSKGTTTNITIPAADPTLSQYVDIYATTSNTILSVNGTASLTPVEPNLPDNTVVVGVILVQPTGPVIVPSTGHYVTTNGNNLNIRGKKGWKGFQTYSGGQQWLVLPKDTAEARRHLGLNASGAVVGDTSTYVTTTFLTSGNYTQTGNVVFNNVNIIGGLAVSQFSVGTTDNNQLNNDFSFGLGNGFRVLHGNRIQFLNSDNSYGHFIREDGNLLQIYNSDNKVLTFPQPSATTDTIALKSDIPSTSGFEVTTNKVGTLDSSATHYPNTAAVKIVLAGYQKNTTRLIVKDSTMTYTPIGDTIRNVLQFARSIHQPTEESPYLSSLSMFMNGAGQGFLQSPYGYANTVVGWRAAWLMRGISSGQARSNSIFGHSAGSSLTTGSFNTFFGTQSGSAITTENLNSMFGYHAGTNMTGVNNFVGGTQAGEFAGSASNAVYIGYQAARNVAGSTKNVLIGANVAVSSSGLAPVLAENTFVGFGIANLINTAANFNSVFGSSAGAAITTGTKFTLLGRTAGTALTTGTDVIAIGINAFSNATAGTNVIAIGSASLPTTGTVTNKLAIGTAIYGLNPYTKASFGLYLGGDDTNAPTALLQLRAGVATAGRTPLKFTTNGVVSTIPEAGALEATNTALFYTDTIATVKTRHQIAFLDAVVRTGTLSSAGTLTLAYSNDYVFSGTTATYTLPAISSTLKWGYYQITIKNRGSGNLTINSSAGGNDIYTTAAVATFILTPGQSCTLINDGTVFNYE